MENKIYRHRASQAGLLLTNGKDDLKLGASLISYLKKNYAENKYGVKEEIHSKYLEKGVHCEAEAIDICAERLGLGILEKNMVHFNDAHFQGTPDCYTLDLVIDTKCSWSSETFLDAVTSPINKDYEAQLQVYMHLLGVKKAKLVYVLLDTPDFVNYGNEITYSHLPINERFYAFDLEYDEAMIKAMQDKVLNCRAFLKDYDNKIKQLLK
ncbi:hypothetical protein UFOVP207_37 [uncultured Caudovirales phage]|uniref:Uncharacterized protein n=1 Tax=uncultured Caudovirales phage TaxID=2100421 RepID=A0A6J7WP44_9CAUD|nr:hypothetical protein UFOVP207_37 [uncultured Caudovirales phage]